MEATLSRIDSGISFRDGGGQEIRGKLLHLTRETVVFEVYSPYAVVEDRDTLRNVTIRRSGEAVFTGTATVRGVASTGTMLIVTAGPSGEWIPLETLGSVERVVSETRSLLQRWDADHALDPAYQIAVGNIRSFLGELSQWLAPIDVAVAAAPAGQREKMAQGMAEQLYTAIEPNLKRLFARFEQASAAVAPDRLPYHRAFAQRELHPLILCAPLIHRSYTKPMGYSGDYGTVNMILSNRMDGPSTYARVMNGFFMRADISQAHRNRIDRLTAMLEAEARRARESGRTLRVLNLGCGPADEVCRFIRGTALADGCEFTLLDFSQETIDHTKARIAEAVRDGGRATKVEFVTQSINDLLKDAVRSGRQAATRTYDLVYCAGLFDYLSDRVCQRLLGLMYQSLAPGGLSVATNVHPRHTVHAILEDLVEWHLILRTESELQALSGSDAAAVSAEATGVNVFLETRKPEGADGLGRMSERGLFARESVPGV